MYATVTTRIHFDWTTSFLSDVFILATQFGIVSSHTKEIWGPSNTTPWTGWVAGFFVLGALLSAVGSLLVAWNYHLEGNPAFIGLHFLSFDVGYLGASASAQRLITRIPPLLLALAACVLACLSLATLNLLAPPVEPGWRILALVFAGGAAGVLGTSLLFAGAPEYSRSLGATAIRCGILFVLGCLTATVITGAAYVTDFPRSAPVALAAIPAVYLAMVLGNRWPTPSRQVQKNTAPGFEPRLIAGALFALLLFFQFGNEWVLAGWLPLFLIRTLGSSPGAAIFSLALFFAALLVGRMLAPRMLTRQSPARVLLASLAVAATGSSMLSFGKSFGYAYAGIFLAGLGFGPVLPVIARSLDERFAFQPRFYNVVLNAAVSGAMCAPWLLGYLDAWLGMRSVLLLPAIGSIMVLLLALLLMFEARLMGATPLGVNGRAQ